VSRCGKKSRKFRKLTTPLGVYRYKVVGPADEWEYRAREFARVSVWLIRVAGERLLISFHMYDDLGHNGRPSGAVLPSHVRQYIDREGL
jgi:hypothetical protein